MAKLKGILIGALLLGVVLTGLYFFTRQKSAASEAAKNQAPRAVPVLLAPVEKKDVPIWLEGLGTVAAWQQASVRPLVDGRLEKVYFKEGQVVKKGQLLAQIDPRPFEVQLHTAEGALARDRATQLDAKINLKRYTTLAGDKLVAQQQVDDQAAVAGQSEGAIKVDEAAIESAKLNLDYAAIKAPLDGVAGVRLIDPGNIVHAADATNTLVIITQLDPAAVYLTAAEDELPRVAAAMKRGDVLCEAWTRDGAKLLGKGKLAVVDNQINQATATLRLKALLPNPDSVLWPNQFVKARLLLDTQRGATVLPAAAVQRGPKGTFVYVIGADNLAQSRDVTVSLITGDIAVLTSGANPGEQVVIEGANQLRPGTLISQRGKDDKGGKGAKNGNEKK